MQLQCFLKQAEYPACTKNRILIVAKAFQSLLCTPLSPLAIEKELPINISHLLSEATWAGIQEALFIVQAGDSAVLQQLLELHALPPSFFCYRRPDNTCMQ